MILYSEMVIARINLGSVWVLYIDGLLSDAMLKSLTHNRCHFLRPTTKSCDGKLFKMLMQRKVDYIEVSQEAFPSHMYAYISWCYEWINSRLLWNMGKTPMNNIFSCQIIASSY